VVRGEDGGEIREKRSKQYSQEELEAAQRLFDNDKPRMAEYLGLGTWRLGTWSLREQLKRNGLNTDKRVESNIKRSSNIPTREDLERLYLTDGIHINDIAAQYKVSHVTVRKWLKEYEISVSLESRPEFERRMWGGFLPVLHHLSLI
jgi:transposase